jgi:hypothetical protein
MKIPESIRINGVDYNIKEESRLSTGTRIAYGRIDYEKSLISLNPDNQEYQLKCQTFLHEVLHGIAHAQGSNAEDDEEVIDMFARGLYQVLQDNARKLFDLKEDYHEHRTKVQLLLQRGRLLKEN